MFKFAVSVHITSTLCQCTLSVHITNEHYILVHITNEHYQCTLPVKTTKGTLPVHIISAPYLNTTEKKIYLGNFSSVECLGFATER